MHLIRTIPHTLGLLALGLLSLTACGGGGGSGPTAPASPKVINSAELKAQKPLSSGSIVVPYREDMDPNSITASHGLMSKGAPVAATSRYEPSTRRVYVKPGAPLTTGQIYTLVIRTSLMTAAGKPALSAEFRWDFRPIKDSSRPRIVARSPKPYSRGAPPDEVSMTFDQAMDARSLQGGFVSVQVRGAKAPLKGQISGDKESKVFTWKPTAGPLAYSTTYVVTVSKSVTNLGGIGMASSVTWSFSTIASQAAPQIIQRSPKPDEIVDVPKEISVAFDMPMQRQSFNASTFYAAPEGGAAVQATMRWYSDRKVALVPNKSLSPSKTYVVTCTKGILSQSGKPLSSLQSWKFSIRKGSGSWGEAEIIHASKEFASLARVAANDQGESIAVWQAEDPYLKNYYDVYASLYRNGKWQPALHLNGTKFRDSSTRPVPSIDEQGRAMVLWHQKANQTTGGLYARRFDGKSWSSPEILWVEPGTKLGRRINGWHLGDLSDIHMDSQGSITVHFVAERYDSTLRLYRKSIERIQFSGTGWKEMQPISMTDSLSEIWDEGGSCGYLASYGVGRSHRMLVWSYDGGRRTRRQPGLVGTSVYSASSGWGPSQIIHHKNLYDRLLFAHMGKNGQGVLLIEAYSSRQVTSYRIVKGVLDSSPSTAIATGGKVAAMRPEAITMSSQGNVMLLYSKQIPKTTLNRSWVSRFDYSKNLWSNSALESQNQSSANQHVIFGSPDNRVYARWYRSAKAFSGYVYNVWEASQSKWVLGNGATWKSNGLPLRPDYSARHSYDQESVLFYAIRNYYGLVAMRFTPARGLAAPQKASTKRGWNGSHRIVTPKGVLHVIKAHREWTGKSYENRVILRRFQ